LPASDSANERAAVEREVSELERLCAALEQALVAGEWDDASKALSDARRATHAFRNAMEAASSARDAAFDEAIYQRVKRVYDARQDQIERLTQFRDQIGQRLQTLSTWKIFARSIGAKNAPARTLGFDSRR
jgi:DNA repair exonuclease SbcCD ATPase subunit